MAEKTNAVRKLDSMKIEYKLHSYDDTGAVSGIEVATAIGENPEQVFKTLVTVAKSGTNYVFLVPVAQELDLKKAAAVVHEKSIEMIKAKELLPLTGYIHGGCSPVGMKKMFHTVVDKSAECFERFYFSGGRIGLQIETSPSELAKVIKYQFADIIKQVN